ncbi:MAG: SH3 domain-containing protein [Nitrospirae bacterium]|nr:SH3 domain-containing protein [Nitrospirota bacterium]
MRRTFLGACLAALLASPAWGQDKTFYVTAVRAELRKGPSYYYPIVGQLKRNAKVTSPKRVGQWFLVLSDQGEGWVTGWLLGQEPVEEGKTSAKPEIDVQQMAAQVVGGESEQAAAPAGAAPKDTETAAAPPAAPSQPQAKSAAPPRAAMILLPNKPKIPLRKAAAKSGRIVTWAPKGMPLEVVGRSGAWFKVRSPKGTEGWVNGYDVDLAGK